METPAAAHVAYVNDIPFLAFRSYSIWQAEGREERDRIFSRCSGELGARAGSISSKDGAVTVDIHLSSMKLTPEAFRNLRLRAERASPEALCLYDEESSPPVEASASA